ncbi:MAG: CobW family GTP-binding protein [Shewanella sp.]
MIVKAVAVNLITGFLGAGKTSLIQQLLAEKPDHETWAVLVNEFGQVGLDAALLSSKHQVHIKQVSGGCMCCASGVPTHIAINQILRQVRPDRLLIEPSGLGHPRQIIKLLQSEHFANVLKLQTSLCLVDATKLSDDRYLQSAHFLEQLSISDLIIATKADSYQADELTALQQLTTELALKAPILAHGYQQSAIANILQTLAQATTVNLKTSKAASANLLRPAIAEDSAPELPAFNPQGIASYQQQLDGHFSSGWIFNSQWQFDLRGLLAAIDGITSLRLKAVFITPDGIAAFNRLESDLTITELDDVMDSRIEVISDQAINSQEILSALIALKC